MVSCHLEAYFGSVWAELDAFPGLQGFKQHLRLAKGVCDVLGPGLTRYATEIGSRKA